MYDVARQRELNVVMVLTQFMPEVFGGAEQQCLRLSRCLAARDVRPHILTSRSDPETPGEEIMQGIPVTRIFSPQPPQYGGRRLLSSIGWMKAVANWLEARRDEIDLVHCHQSKFNAWVGTRTARRLGIPCLVKPGSAGPNFDLYSLEQKRFLYGRIAARSVVRNTDTFVGISREMMKDLADYGIAPEKRVMIPNGVVMPEPDPVRRAQVRARIRAEIGAVEGQRVLLFAGRMEQQKNVETLLHAFAKTMQAGLSGKLVLLGDGALLNEHKALARQLDLSEYTVFAGRVDTVPDYLSAADLFVLPALAEGMSNAVLEAMAAGVPQIVSDVSGNDDLVVHGQTGWLYGAPRDTNSLVHALSEAITAPAERLRTMSEATAARARDTFAIDVVADRYRALYDTLLAKGTVR